MIRTRSFRRQWPIQYGCNLFILWHINLCRLLNAEAIVVEEQQWYYWMHNGVHTFPTGISSKVNVISRIEFELAYDDVTIQYISYYAKGTPLHTHTHTHTLTHTHIYICECVYMCVCVYVCACMCVRAHTSIRLYPPCTRCSTSINDIPFELIKSTEKRKNFNLTSKVQFNFLRTADAIDSRGRQENVSVKMFM